jgi:hypothetical protein
MLYALPIVDDVTVSFAIDPTGTFYNNQRKKRKKRRISKK